MSASILFGNYPEVDDSMIKGLMNLSAHVAFGIQTSDPWSVVKNDAEGSSQTPGLSVLRSPGRGDGAGTCIGRTRVVGDDYDAADGS